MQSTTTGTQAATRSRLMRPLAVAAVSAAAIMGPQAVGVASAAPELVAAPGPSCADVEVVFARGTFEAPGVGATGQAFVDALTSQLPGKRVDVYGVNYPASLDFQAGAQGVTDTINRVEATAASCPNTKIVLGGYSQGAAVAAYTTAATVPAGYTLPAGVSLPMPPAVADNVSAVVLFGTPDPWFLGLVDHSAPPIAIGPEYTSKTIQLCNTGDPVCFPGGFDRAAHSAYKDNGMAVQAATFAANTVSSNPV